MQISIDIILTIFIALSSGLIGGLIGYAANYRIFQLNKRIDLYEIFLKDIIDIFWSFKRQYEIIIDKDSSFTDIVSDCEKCENNVKGKIKNYNDRLLDRTAQLEIYSKISDELLERINKIINKTEVSIKKYSDVIKDELWREKNKSHTFLKEIEESVCDIDYQIKKLSRLIRNDISPFGFIRYQIIKYYSLTFK